MALTTFAGVSTAVRQRLSWVKTGTRTTTTLAWSSMFDLAGNPAAGTLAAGSTAAGQVPDDSGTLAGFLPMVNTFGAGTGYLARVECYANVACRLLLYDRLYQAGAYSFNSNVSLSAQPSFTARIPGGTDYTNVELWIETVTNFTGNMTVAIGYNNQASSPATAPSFAPGIAPVAGRMFQIPLAAGDTGASLLTSVVSTVATVGTFNVLLLRPLLMVRMPYASAQSFFGPDQTGLIQIFQHSAFQVMCTTDATTSPQCEIYMEVVNG